MHKNPLQNTGKGIKGTLFFGTFRGSMPLEPSRGFCAFSASRADSCVPPPPKISRPVRLCMESVKICRFKTFWMGIFARGALLLFRCFNIHDKMCVLLRY